MICKSRLINYLRNVFYILILLISTLISSTSLHLEHQNDDNINYYDQPKDTHGIYSEFPNIIHSFHPRIDHFTGGNIERGRLQLLSGPNFNDEYKKVTYDEFVRILQCSKSEPGINGMRGSMNLIKMIKPSKHIIELMCAWVETLCVNDGKWDKCHEYIDYLRKNIKRDKIVVDRNMLKNPYYVVLIRIMNSTIYYDWPWNIEQFDDGKELGLIATYFRKFQVVLDKISDLPDSVFFLGREMSYMPYNFPFPGFSESPSLKSNDIPMPWIRSILSEYQLYEKVFLRSSKPKFKLYHLYHSANFEDWMKRTDKAAFYGSLTSIRSIAFSTGVLRPDLVEAGWPSSCCPWRDLPGWNPEATKQNWTEFGPKFNHSKPKLSVTDYFNKLGYLESFESMQIEHAIDYMDKKYKYLIVLAGLDGQASADRLANLLAHSGAVILLQTTEFEYHFSARLKPWIHYVPISYNTADIISKVEWLKKHQHMAYKIAQNAKIFGESYLRLEDYYCYIATTLKTLGDYFKGTDALHPFNATKIIGIPRSLQ